MSVFSNGDAESATFELRIELIKPIRFLIFVLLGWLDFADDDDEDEEDDDDDGDDEDEVDDGVTDGLLEAADFVADIGGE
jgi:hypothetical protein